jgi:hypothetical protein
MSTAPVPQSTTDWTAPEHYKPDETKLNEMWDAAGRGDWMRVSVLIGDLEVGWLGQEMKRLAELGNHYGTLEKGADSFMAVLNAHTKDGKVEASQVMLDFVDTGVELTTKAGNPPSTEVMEIITKIKSGEEISQEEAQKLYAWCADAKLLAVPAEYSSEALAAQAKSARERYDRYVAAGKTRIDTWSAR